MVFCMSGRDKYMPSNYDEIRAENIREYGEGTRHLSLLGRMYSDRTHFIFELLQNAEDAGATKVSFKLGKDSLEYRHDGKVFNSADVKGICGVAASVKSEDITKIGRFGIGFKSVYAYTSKPEIHSGGESFFIENYVRPYALNAEKVSSPWTTLFKFIFNCAEVHPDIAFKEISERLKGLSARTLLFLRNITEIEWSVATGESGQYLRDSKENDGYRKILVVGQSNTGPEEDESWMVFERNVGLPDGNKSKPVEIAFALKRDKETNQQVIERISESPLVVFFPTEKDTRLGFMIQGPYRTTPARDNIPKDDVWNQLLVRETAELVVTTLHKLRDIGLLGIGVLQAMPIRTEDYPVGGMFHPIYSRVKKELLASELLPLLDESSYSSGSKVKLGRGAEIRKLLGCKELSEYFTSDKDINWLTAGITQERTPELRRYLIHELNIEEITPEIFARKIPDHFLYKQSDDWMIGFYKFLLGQESLWRLNRSHWGGSGALRFADIVRLENGQHAAPFTKDGIVQVYLPCAGSSQVKTVKKELLADSEVKEFFERLGVSEPDVVAEIIEEVIPLYEVEHINVSKEEHSKHINMIMSGLRTDSIDRVELLKIILVDTRFIAGENAVDGSAKYCAPVDLYIRSEGIDSYFADNPETFFVSNQYSPEEFTLFERLDVAKSPRVKLVAPSNNGFVKVSEDHGWHRRGMHGFDPGCSVDGLEEAMERPSYNKSLYIWNNIVVRYEKQIKGKVESSTRKSYEGSKKEVVYSEFGKILAECSWLPLNDEFHKPSDLSLSDLTDAFYKSDGAAAQLSMKGNEIDQIARRAGIDPEDLSLIKALRENPAEYERVKSYLDKIRNKPIFPDRKSASPERRREKVHVSAGEAEERVYEERQRSVRVSGAGCDPKSRLIELYTNDDDQLVCQICEEEMPFKKKNGEYYFEAVELFNGLNREHEQNYAALCPVCAAKYKEFIKSDMAVQTSLKNEIIKNSVQCFDLNLGEMKGRIRFVEVHLADLAEVIDVENGLKPSLV